MLELIMDVVVETYQDTAGFIEKQKTEISRGYKVLYRDATKMVDDMIVVETKQHKIKYDEATNTITTKLDKVKAQKAELLAAKKGYLEAEHSTSKVTTDDVGNVPISPRFGEFERMVEAEDATPDHLPALIEATIAQELALDELIEIHIVQLDNARLEYEQDEQAGKDAKSTIYTVTNVATVAATAVISVAPMVMIPTVVGVVAIHVYDYTVNPDIYDNAVASVFTY